MIKIITGYEIFTQIHNTESKEMDDEKFISIEHMTDLLEIIFKTHVNEHTDSRRALEYKEAVKRYLKKDENKTTATDKGDLDD